MSTTWFLDGFEKWKNTAIQKHLSWLAWYSPSTLISHAVDSIYLLIHTFSDNLKLFTIWGPVPVWQRLLNETDIKLQTFRTFDIYYNYNYFFLWWMLLGRAPLSSYSWFENLLYTYFMACKPMAQKKHNESINIDCLKRKTESFIMILKNRLYAGNFAKWMILKVIYTSSPVKDLC